MTCSCNRLLTIPLLPNLKRLYCYSNKITSIPVLPNLEILDCCYNQITLIPMLPKLELLYCSLNQITIIQDTNILTRIYCPNNPIYEIIGDCSLINSSLKLHHLNRFIELFYYMKCKKRLRNFYYERILKPKMESRYHPNNLALLIEGQDNFEELIESW